MEIGAITGHIDVAQVVLYAFWLFFAGLIIYLRREDRREGYPLEDGITGKVDSIGVTWMATPKRFALPEGGFVEAPDFKRETRPLNAEPIAAFPGAPLRPTGDPMLAGVGPGAWAERKDIPDMTVDGKPRIVPMRSVSDFGVVDGEPDPRGMPVVGGDGKIGGTVTDVWVDTDEVLIRYVEMTVGSGEDARTVLVPAGFADVRGGKVDVPAIYSDQFAAVPGIAASDRITRLEEEKIMGYFGAGLLYADARRQEPIL
ncbi:MAG: photosynthetic reaction center subunit H [Thalassobaculum sp.]|jgi:photosynthetic reaction center H subunit